MNRNCYAKMLFPYGAVWKTVALFCFTVLLFPLVALAGREEPDLPVMAPKTVFVPVYRTETAETVSMDLQSYLCSVLYGEMPPNYHEEALKAQTVAAFTYLLYRQNLVQDAHPEAWVCDNPAHCKAFRSAAEVRQDWGDYWFETYSPRVRDAVSAVLYTYMCYENAPINAVFHSVSSGNTERAADVWGTDIPYLQAVFSGFDETAEGFATEKTVSAGQFAATLEKLGVVCEGDSGLWISQTVRSASGGVVQQTVCGKTLSGTDMRKAFGLRSANYTVMEQNGMFTFSVKGYGHGVGMSQYGANQLALQGYDWQEILQYYYTDVSFATYCINT